MLILGIGINLYRRPSSVHGGREGGPTSSRTIIFYALTYPMKAFHYTSVSAEEVKVEGAKKARIRWLLAEKDGVPNFCMRLFEVEPGGCTPYHTHPWEHEVFVLEGEGEVVTDKEKAKLEPGVVVFVPPNQPHQFLNTGDKTLKFICLIPLRR